MNSIVDIHTHNPHARQALISVGVGEFDPQPGQFYSVGIHPWQVATASPDALDALPRLASHRQVLAVGETGLDSLRGGPLAEQSRLMAAHIAVAEQVDKPLVVHCVRTAQQVMRLWRDTAPHRVPLAIHGFRGNERVARLLLESGFYLSYGVRFNAAAVVETPIDRLLIETDEGPADIAQVAQAVAEVRGITAEQLLRVTTANAARFLGMEE